MKSRESSNRDAEVVSVARTDVANEFGSGGEACGDWRPDGGTGGRIASESEDVLAAVEFGEL